MTSEISELFTKRLPVTVKYQDRENRKCHIQISIELHTNTAPVHRKELVVRLTDETDLFFLHTLRLNEEEFQSLKVQQGLLVDFGAFPQKFIDLLELCLSEEHNDVPKFILDLVSNGSAPGCTANLNVIETNPFKHLTHLSLKFLPGTDTDIKKYLADCLKTLKEQNMCVLDKLQHTEGDLSTQLRQAREALSSRTVELDNLKAEWASRTSELSIKHRQEMTEDREKAMQSQRTIQEKYEREKQELEQNHNAVIRRIETKLAELETTNKDLTDRKYKSESTIRELKGKLSASEDENIRLKQDVQSLRKNNASLDAECHEQEKVINQLKTRLAVFEQEVKDKEQVLQKTSDLLSTEQEHKKKNDDDVERKKRHISKLESSVKTMSDELVKGNEIIKKLQGEIRSYHTKLKLRNQVTTEQEKLLTEKNKEMETIRKDLEEVKTILRNKEEENKKLNDNLEVTMQKLEESRQLLKTNENVINWLNKQVTEQQLHTHGGTLGSRSGPFELNSTAASSQYSRQNHIHNYSAAPGSSVSGASSHQHHQHQQQQHHIPPAQQQVQYQAGGGIKTSVPAPLAKSSPIGPIPEESRPGMSQQASTASPKLPARTAANANVDPLLDRYLQKTDDHPLRPSGRVSPNAMSLHFKQALPHPASGPSTTTTSSSARPQPTRPSSAGMPYNNNSRTTTIPSSHARPASAAGVPYSGRVGGGGGGGVTYNPNHHPPPASTRLSRDVITGPPPPPLGRQTQQQQTIKPGQQQQPPLASAYFPNQAKVT